MAGKFYGATQDQWQRFAEMARSGQLRNVPPPSPEDLPRNQQQDPRVATDWGAPGPNADALSPRTASGQRWLQAGYANVSPEQMRNRAQRLASRYYSTGENPGAEPAGWRQYLGPYMPDPGQAMTPEWQGYQPWWERSGAERSPDPSRYPTDPIALYWQRHPEQAPPGYTSAATPGLESAQRGMPGPFGLSRPASYGSPMGARPRLPGPAGALAGPLDMSSVSFANPGGAAGYWTPQRMASADAAMGTVADQRDHQRDQMTAGPPMGFAPLAYGQGMGGGSPMDWLGGQAGYGAGYGMSGGMPQIGLADLFGGFGGGLGMVNPGGAAGYWTPERMDMARVFDDSARPWMQGQDVGMSTGAPGTGPTRSRGRGGGLKFETQLGAGGSPITNWDQYHQMWQRQLQQKRGDQGTALAGLVGISAKGSPLSGAPARAEVDPTGAQRFGARDLAIAQNFADAFNRRWG